MNIIEHNRKAWDNECAKGNPWTIPVDNKTMQDAKQGKPHLFLTSGIETPLSWLPPLQGTKVLCLASGGGQQTPQFAALGADVTVLDNSPAQLASDQKTAATYGLTITSVLGDMQDLSCFPESSFDLIFNPISNLFVPDVRAVWKECERVLKPCGILLAGFINPARFMFDQGSLLARHALPFNSLDDPAAPYTFSHTLEDQLGGICDAGFAITALQSSHGEDALERMLFDAKLAIRAVKR